MSELFQDSNVFCPLCEAETDVPMSDVVSPTIPPIMPGQVAVAGILRHRGHVCRPEDMQAKQAADLVKELERRMSKVLTEGIVEVDPDDHA